MGEAVSGVRVLSISRVAPAPSPSPAQASHQKVKLSYIDTPYVTVPPIQLLLLYELAGSDEFWAVVRRLKDSLAATLALYLPLAGKLAYEEETGDLVVQCSDAGVSFYEAEATGGGGMDDVRRLAGDDAHDVPAFLSLAPEHEARVLPAPLLRLQATRLGARGLALVLSFHHAVVDGVALEGFMCSWASIFRGGKPLGPRGFGREAIDRYNADGNELARKLLTKVAPNLPEVMRKDDYMVLRSRLACWRLCLSADDIRLLKRRINDEPASTFVALLAFLWTAFVRSKGLALKGDDTAYLLFPFDLRSRFQPPISKGYFGNCAIGCGTSAIVGELLGETGLLHASRAIRAAIKEAEKAPLAALQRWIDHETKKLPPSATFRVAGTPLFPMYDAADFGFGRPARAELVNIPQDGRIVLFAGERKGDVQVTVSLNPAHMATFIANVNCRPKSKL